MKKISYLLAVLITLCLCSFTIQAQETTTKTKTKAKTHAMSVTGCLAKGAVADEYTLTDATGKTYQVRAKSGVDLAAHVGHTVTIAGHMGHETAKEEMKEEKTETKEKSETKSKESYLRATSVTMVSDTCTK